MADGASAGAASTSEVTFRVRYAETDQILLRERIDRTGTVKEGE